MGVEQITNIKREFMIQCVSKLGWGANEHGKSINEAAFRISDRNYNNSKKEKKKNKTPDKLIMTDTRSGETIFFFYFLIKNGVQ